jgi:phosphocarrier protein FPr
MDLGSAVLSAELAVDFLDEDRRSRVLLSDAPLVEGAVAAVVAARLGEPLDRVAAEARGGLLPKTTHLHGEDVAAGSAGAPGPVPAGHELVIVVNNEHGLHARPAARLVKTAGQFEAEIMIENTTNGRGPVTARSLISVTTLGVEPGHEVRLRASGPDAAAALAEIEALAADNFGDTPSRQ